VKGLSCYPSSEQQPCKSSGGTGKAGRAACPSRWAGQGLPVPSPDQQRVPETCERSDSAKEGKRGSRNTKSARLDGVKFPSRDSHGEQGSGVLLPGYGGNSWRSSCSKRRPWSPE